jgi:hypothetical protein
MSNIRLSADYGSVVHVGGVCYKKADDQPSTGVPNKSIATGDTINISSRTFTVDDDGVSGGSNHRTWTACEVCVSEYMSIHRGAVSFSNENGVKKTLFTAPYGGIIRVWRTTSSFQFSQYLLINDVIVNDLFGPSNITDSVPWKLAKDDVFAVQARDTTSFAFACIFLPYQWPQPE